MRNDVVPKAERRVIEAAEKWARAIIRRDYALAEHEDDLFNAVMILNNLSRGKVIDPDPLPKPPRMPAIEYNSVEEDTLRYSGRPTKPTPKGLELDLTELGAHKIIDVGDSK